MEAALVLLREAGIHVLNYLDDWLILAQSRALLCGHRDTVLSHLSRLGLQVNWEKSKLSPMQKISLVGLGQPHSTSLSRACSVYAELPGVFLAQEGGSTETLSEAPGAYGIHSCCHAARTASYETDSALASRPGPEMGMATRHVPGLTSARPSGRMATHTSHCQLFYSLPEKTLGTDALAHSWPRGLRKYAFSSVSLLAQTLCKVREDEEQVLLVAPYWPNRTWFPELMLLATLTPW